jgi:hypothetical protein
MNNEIKKGTTTIRNKKRTRKSQARDKKNKNRINEEEE